MESQADLSHALAAQLAQAAPRHVLALGAPAQALLAALLPPDCRVEGLEAGPDALAALGDARFDLALVMTGWPPTLPTLLGRLRDLHAGRILLALDEDAAGPEVHGALMGLGFVRAGRYRHEQGWQRLYQFDIASYKTTPDWLNSRDWANPKLWDKHRW